MKKTIFQKLFRTLALLTVICLFQNCSTIKDNSKKPNAHSHLVETGLKCPLYLKPNCLKDETLELVENKKGCSYLTCTKQNRITRCPEQSRPSCYAHQFSVTELDSNSCFYSFCKLKVVKNIQITTVLKPTNTNQQTCTPSLKTPVCHTGTKAVSYLDSSGCLQKKCKPTRRFSCKTKTVNLCKKTETAYTEFDEKGCAKLVCKNNLKIMCPARLKASCKWNEDVVVETDQKGCKKTTCSPKPVVKIKGCKLSHPPICKPWQKLTAALGQNNCRKITCK